MEESRFDDLLRKAAQHATRRETFGALLGSALLLGDPLESEAARKTKRRKKRDQRQSSATAYRGMSIQVDNSHGANLIFVQHGTFDEYLFEPSCCVLTTFESVPAGQSKVFEAPSIHAAFVFVNNRYWFQFFNPFVGLPWASIALDGTFWAPEYTYTCCDRRGFKRGVSVEQQRGFDKGETRPYNIDTARFTVRRNGDTPNQISFTVIPPANL